MTVVAIDPGTRESAWLTFNGSRIVAHGIEDNERVLRRFAMDSWTLNGFGPCSWEDRPEAFVFEQIESFGMAVGREVFETVFWTGRLYQAAWRQTLRAERMTRREVKLHLCQSARAQDANIRAALMDRFGGERAKGTKANQGPLYGIKSHEWSALAIAVTWWDLRRPQQPALDEPTQEPRPSLADA